MESIGAFLPLILIFGVFYILLIRPQQRKVKQHREMLSNLRRGDKIITSGGIFPFSFFTLILFFTFLEDFFLTLDFFLTFFEVFFLTLDLFFLTLLFFFGMS